MPMVKLLVAESVDADGVYALDPHFYDGRCNATSEFYEARCFQSKKEAVEWCKANPHPPFCAMELTLNFPYLH